MTDRVIIDENNWLNCPICNDFYLHQRKVITLFRDCEDDEATQCEISGGSFWVDDPRAKINICRKKAKDIPGRRDVIVIEFDCEICKNTSLLRIMQHKGLTLVEWVDNIMDR